MTAFDLRNERANICIRKSYPDYCKYLAGLGNRIENGHPISTLHEMLDAVPYNKILLGGDVSRIDDVVGSLELGKEVVAIVLINN